MSIRIPDKIRTEPVLVSAFVQSLLALVVAFGLDLSPEQIGSILAATAALLAFVARSKVSPVYDPDQVVDYGDL